MRLPRRTTASQLALLMAFGFATGSARAQDAPNSAAPITHSKAKAAPVEAPAAEAVPPLPVTPIFDKSLFDNTLPPEQLAFLKQFDGVRSKDLYHDKQFKIIKKETLPKWMFHYGHDMSVTEAMDAALGDSKDAVVIRDGRYVMLSGTSELYPFLQGRGFLWIDMQDGLTLAGFYFRPTNGEPSPTLTVFSNQLSVGVISMDRLPPAFFQDYNQWIADERIAPLTTRYFIGALNQRILLEHDEDFCKGAYAAFSTSCEEMTAAAADLDINTAYYLDQVHYATNATAWMINGQELTSFIAYRSGACASVVDPLGCRIRLTRTQITRVGHPMAPPRPIHR